jgi:DNA-damage-inducible protein D
MFEQAFKYWNKLMERLCKEGSQLVTGYHQLKMLAAGGKQRPTDAATAETRFFHVSFQVSRLRTVTD